MTPSKINESVARFDMFCAQQRLPVLVGSKDGAIYAVAFNRKVARRAKKLLPDSWEDYSVVLVRQPQRQL